MRRAVIVLLVVLVALIGIGWLADRIAVGATARGIESDISAGGVELAPDAEVRIEGFPYLTQLMVSRLSEVNLTSSTATIEGLRLEDVSGFAKGVETSTPYTARDAQLTATIPEATIHEALTKSQLAERGLDIDVRIRGSAVVVSTSFLSLPVEAVLRPFAAGRSVALEVRAVSVAGIRVSADDLPDALREALADLRVPLETLPEGLQLSEVRVLPEGLIVTLTGSDVALGSLVLQE